jgi:biotin transport system substrate-specific component
MLARLEVLRNTKAATLQNGLTIVFSTFIIAICSQCSILIPFISSVPFSLQCHAVLLLSAFLGARKAFIALALYLFEGACGLPVFTYGHSGILYLMGPTAGYLFSYLPVSYLTGKCFEKVPSADWSTRVSFFAFNNVLILLFGFLWLSTFVGMEKGWNLGVYPFMGTDLLKTLVIASGIPMMRRVQQLFQ